MDLLGALIYTLLNGVIYNVILPIWYFAIQIDNII